MDNEVGNSVASMPDRCETPEPTTANGNRRFHSTSKSPPDNDDVSSLRSPSVFEDSFDYPDSEVERKKLINDALQQEDEFLEYLMSLPAAKEKEQETAVHQPIFTRSASTYSGCSTGATPKVGLDHLDNLCKLMEQLGELREQNSKLQRRVQYLEDMKNLQEMHRQLQNETRRMQGQAVVVRRSTRGREDGGNLTDSCLLDGSDDSLPRSRFSSGKAKTRQNQPTSHHQRGRSRSVGIEDGKDEVEEEEDDDDGGGGAGGSKQRGGRAKRRDKSRQRRSLAAAGEVGGGGSGKAKVSKWTKVKEAFRWEKAAASVLPEAKSADSGLGGVAEDARYLRVPPPGAGDHSSPADSALSGHSSSACSSAGGQSPGLRLGDFALPPLDTLSSSSSSDDLDLDLTFSDIMRELGPQRSASVADSRASARDTRRHSLSQLVEEEDASRRSKSLDGDVTLIASHFSTKDALAKIGHGGKPHKTPWGKVKDIIQTRKDSLKRRHRGKTPADHEDDAYASVDVDLPSTPGDVRDESLQDAVPQQQQQQQQAARPARQSVAEGGRRQQCKISTCSLGSHPLALEPPPASRRLTPTLTITLPSTEELRSAPAALPDASPQTEDRCHKTSTASAPDAAEDGGPSASAATSSSSSELNRHQAPGGRPATSSAGTSPPASLRASSKWTKVKKAFLTSAPGKREDGSAPGSPNRHSSFSYDLDADELSSGEFTEAATENGDAAPSPPQPPPLPPRQVLQAEVQRNYEQLQQKLSLEFHRKLSEWERIKTAAATSSSSGPAAAPNPDDGGGHNRDKSFRRKLEEWERLRGRGKEAADDGRLRCRRILLHEDNLSADFRKKLHEWQRIKEAAAGLPKKRSATEWQLWRGRGGGEEQSAAGWDSGAEDGGVRTPSPGVSRKNSGGGSGGGSGKSKRGSGSRGKSPDKAAVRKKDLQWLEKELHKIDREKQRLEREREKFLEREARLEKMRTAMGSRPRKQEVLVQTSTGFFRFQGISEKFTRRLYEWEEARGIGPEASTFALLDPGYKPRLPGNKGGGAEAVDGGPLSRSKSASSVSNMAVGGGISHQPSSLSLNDVGVLEHVEAAVVVAALEDARASSEPHLRSADGESPQPEETDGPRAVIVDVEDVVEETAAPLLVAREVQGHTPVYCYAPAEVTRLIDSSGSESDKDSARMVQRAESTRTQSSYKLIEENMNLLDELKLKEDICRQIENEMGNLEAKIEHVAKTHEEEIERLKKEEADIMLQEGASNDILLGRLRDKILDLETRQQRLLKEGASLQESFAEQSEQQAAIAQSIVGNVKQLKAASSSVDGEHPDTGAAADEEPSQGDAVVAVQELSSSLLALAEKLEISLARRSRKMRSLRIKRDGKSKPSAQRFRAGLQWYSEEGISVSMGSLHSEDGEEASQTSEDMSHLPALLTHKVLELKQALNKLCAHTEASTKDKAFKLGAVPNSSGEESTATFVVKVGKKRNVSQPIVHVDSGGSISPVSVTITPAFWKRKLQRQSSTFEDDSVDTNDAVNLTMDKNLNSDIKRLNFSTACQETRTDSAGEEIIKSNESKDDTAVNIEMVKKMHYCDPSDNSSRKYDVENKENAISMSISASKNGNSYETEVFLKDPNYPSGRQKKLLKTRRVSDTYMGYNRQNEGKTMVRRQKECDERCDEDNTNESIHEVKNEEDEEEEARQPRTRVSSKNVTAIAHEHMFEESPLSGCGYPTSSEGPIVSSRTTFLLHESGERNTPSSPVNIFVPTTRKIFSPIRRDSKGKTSTVISYVVSETTTELPSPTTKGTALKEGNKEDEKKFNGVQTPAPRILRGSRSHSSSPCLKRRQFDNKEQTYMSKEELMERSKELQGGINAMNYEPRTLTNGVESGSDLNSTNDIQKPEEERSSPLKVFPPLSPGPVKRELNRSVSKETAPSIRLMIARYNQKLTEQEGAGGRSPDVSHSGSGSPVAWRSPATERRVRVQTEKYQEEVRKVLEQGERKAGTTDVQKSASTGVIRSLGKQEEPSKTQGNCDLSTKKPPMAVVQPRGILKSSSAGAIKPMLPLPPYQTHILSSRIYEDRSVLPPPEQFKDEQSTYLSQPASPQPSVSPGPSSPSSPELEEPLRLRYLRLQKAKEEFLSRGLSGRSWASEGGGDAGSARSRLSQISVGSESSFEGSEAAAALAHSGDEDDPLLVKSASAGMISVESGAYRRLSAESKAAGGSRSRFGLAGLASRFRKVKMRKAKGRDAPSKLNTVSILCRQSLLVDLHLGRGSSRAADGPLPPPSSKSCPSSPVLQRSSSGSRVDDDGAKASGSWLRRPAKIFKHKQ